MEDLKYKLGDKIKLNHDGLLRHMLITDIRYYSKTDEWLYNGYSEKELEKYKII